MTSFENIGVSLGLHRENGQENKSTMHGRKTKIHDRTNIPKPSKRVALGTITNNATRVQPFRSAKATGQEVVKERSAFGSSSILSENVAPSVFTTGQPTYQGINCRGGPSFSIHVDSEIEVPHYKQQTDLHNVVTGLAGPTRAFKDNSTVAACSNVLGSPMVLDTTDDDILVISLDETKLKDTIENIDAKADPLYEVPEYGQDIHNYLKEAELKFRPKPGYMKKQTDINNSMRAILVDWLVEVAEEYKLTPQTLYLSVNFIDRFLSHMSVLRGKLQLVGTACMLVASKYEEIYPPEVAEFVYITDDTYTAKQVLRMEHLVLKTLAFDLSAPTTLDFLHRYLKAANCPPGSCQLESLARYLCELTLLDADPFLQYLPSVIAASAVYLACLTLNLPAWTPTMSHYTSLKLGDVRYCIHDMHKKFVNAPSHAQQAIREKYKLSKRSFHLASLWSSTWIYYQQILEGLLSKAISSVLQLDEVYERKDALSDSSFKLFGITGVCLT